MLMTTSSKNLTQPDSGIDLTRYVTFLRANSEAYEWLVEKSLAVDPYRKREDVLGRVLSAAGCAARFHPGRFADGTLETSAFKIGSELVDPGTEYEDFILPVPSKKKDHRRVLHVASFVLGVGGHTRMLNHWVRNDQTSYHSLMLLNQGDKAVPRWLIEAIRSSGGELIVATSDLPLVKKAKWLRELARVTADLVVLHTEAADVVPVVAFAVHDCPPVVKVNNDDHTFWLGSSVSDMVINTRTAGAELAANRRFVSSNMVLPVPLDYPLTMLKKRDARRLLGIAREQIVLLSIGRPEKYRPSGSFDFVRTAEKILDRHPEAHLYVVGESVSGIAPSLSAPLHKRLHFVGSIEDPSPYRAAADVYLESFPFGSQTALLEAALSALPVVSAYAPLFPLLVANDDAIQDLIDNPINEQEYIERVSLLIREPQSRTELGTALQKRLSVDHVGNGWLQRLYGIYQETDLMTHNPRLIPSTSCSTTEQDIGLSLWHCFWHVSAGRKNPRTNIHAHDVSVLSHTAYLAKCVGRYSRARRFAWRTLCRDPYNQTSWRLLVAALVGRAERPIRQVLRRTVKPWIGLTLTRSLRPKSYSQT